MKDAKNNPLSIIVTGSRSGLGLAIANELAKRHVVYRYDLDGGDDVCSPGACSWLDDVVSDEVDVLINCAGINANEWFEDITMASFDALMHTNAYSFVAMTQACLPALKESKGVVINIVSNAAHIPMTSSLAYNASKAAGLMITKQMAHELTPKYGITVLSISPNKLCGTGMSRHIEENVCKTRGWTPEFAAEYQKKALMHGLETDPQAIAEMIGHLLMSGGIQFMSGTDIPFGK